jgi:hypothetical protein
MIASELIRMGVTMDCIPNRRHYAWYEGRKAANMRALLAALARQEVSTN